ncbi:MAG: threonine/serine exporter family protein [Bacteroidales bacterium]|nr:threonine/serine exporter family protein [Bacteroidales bacterium]
MNTAEQSAEILSFASDAGHVLLENGAEISRVEETMERITTHYGEEKDHFFVLSNGIFTTGHGYANVDFIPIKGARLDKVVAINQLSRDISAGRYSLPQARERLDQIRNMPAKPLWEQVLGAALGSGGFCAIFGGSFLDCAASLVAGTLVYLFLLLVCIPYMSKTLGNILSGLLGTAACILFHSLGFGAHLGNMMVGALIPLIPGVAFTNGLRDIANEDYLAGITRLLDAVLVFLSIAIGVCLAFIAHSFIAGGMIQLKGTLTDPVTARLPIQLAAALVGTASFAVLFGVPRRFCLPAGAVGMLGWLAYLMTVRYTPLAVVGGTFVAATLVAFLSRWSARMLRCPSTVFLICGIFPLIPGAGVFWTSYYVVSEQMRASLQTGLLAFEVTIAIVLGIIIAANIFGKKYIFKT